MEKAALFVAGADVNFVSGVPRRIAVEAKKCK